MMNVSGNSDIASNRIDRLFDPVALRNTTLPNRFVRSAAYEGCGDASGTPRAELADLYLNLAAGGSGTIITGFVFVSQSGRAMQPRQCGIDTAAKAAAWKGIADAVHAGYPDLRLFMQLAHTGRQTRRESTGMAVVGASRKKCSYFKQRVKILDDTAIRAIVRDFADAARRAKDAGFDGVQIHAAHGYLIHQFLSPWTNTRTDKWADGPLFLEEIVRGVKETNGADFPVLIKMSCADDNAPGIDLENAIRTVRRLESLNVDAVEISYGTMELPLNIIRGACPADVILAVSPLFRHIPVSARKIWKRLFLPGYLRKLKPFTPDYNVGAARSIMMHTRLPVIPVGGIRTAQGMLDCLESGLAAVSMCRPLICEPDLPAKIRAGDTIESQCINCNLCTAYCESERTVRCYHQTEDNK